MTPQNSSSSVISALQGTLQRLGLNYKYAAQIVQASDAVIQNGKLPAGLSEQEKANLVAAITALKASAETIRRLGEQIETALPIVQANIAKQNEQITIDFKTFSAELEKNKQQSLAQMSQSENQTHAELKKLEEAYKAQKEALKTKLKQLAEAKKTADKDFVNKKKTAEIALQKAVFETNANPPEYDRGLLQNAQTAETNLVTELNKTKGHLQTVFAAPQDAETLKAILG